MGVDEARAGVEGQGHFGGGGGAAASDGELQVSVLDAARVGTRVLPVRPGGDTQRQGHVRRGAAVDRNADIAFEGHPAVDLHGDRVSVDIGGEGRACVEVYRDEVLADTVDQRGQHAPDLDDVGGATRGIEPFAAVPGMCGEGGKGVFVVEGFACCLGLVAGWDSMWKKESKEMQDFETTTACAYVPSIPSAPSTQFSSARSIISP